MVDEACLATSQDAAERVSNVARKSIHLDASLFWYSRERWFPITGPVSLTITGIPGP